MNQEIKKSDEPKTYYAMVAIHGFYVPVRNPKTEDVEPQLDKQGNFVYGSKGQQLMREEHLQFHTIVGGRSTGKSGDRAEPTSIFTVSPTKIVKNSSNEEFKIFTRRELDIIAKLEKSSDDPRSPVIREKDYRFKINPEKAKADDIIAAERQKHAKEIESKDRMILEMQKQLEQLTSPKNKRNE